MMEATLIRIFFLFQTILVGSFSARAETAPQSSGGVVIFGNSYDPPSNLTEEEKDQCKRAAAERKLVCSITGNVNAPASVDQGNPKIAPDKCGFGVTEYENKSGKQLYREGAAGNGCGQGGEPRYAQSCHEKIMDGKQIGMKDGCGDCSGFVSAALCAAGNKLKESDSCGKCGVTNTEELLDSTPDCLMLVKDNPAAGDIFVCRGDSSGHTVMVSAIDPNICQANIQEIANKMVVHEYTGDSKESGVGLKSGPPHGSILKDAPELIKDACSHKESKTGNCKLLRPNPKKSNCKCSIPPPIKGESCVNQCLGGQKKN